MASGRNRSSLISPALLSLPNNTNVVVIRSHMSNLFHHSFSCTNNLHLLGWSTKFPYLDIISANELEISFSEEEINWALLDAEGDKPPGPYEFPFRFVQSFLSFFGRISLVSSIHFLNLHNLITNFWNHSFLLS